MQELVKFWGFLKKKLVNNVFFFKPMLLQALTLRRLLDINHKIIHIGYVIS